MTHFKYLILLLPLCFMTGCYELLSNKQAAELAKYYAEELSDGKRTKGTSAEADAADFIVQELTAAGLNPKLQYFDATNGEIVADPSLAVVPSQNVIVEITGKRKADGVIILGAHYDSVPQTESTGYGDNASGTAVAMATAIALKHTAPLPYAVRIIFFGAEESCPAADCPDPALIGTGGVKGSSAYTSTLTTDDVSEIIAMLNLDTVAGGDFIYAHGDATGTDGWVRERLTKLAKKRKTEVKINPGNEIPYADNAILYPEGTTGPWSDHWPFQQRGIAVGYLEATNWQIADLDGYEQIESLFISTGNGAIWHTDRDTKAFMDTHLPGLFESQMEDVVDLVLEFIRKPKAPKHLSAGALARREAAICAEVVGKKVASTPGEGAMRDYLVNRLNEIGYKPDVHTFAYTPRGSTTDDISHNVFAVKKGKRKQELIIGAHYDSVPQNDGNGYTDNCSGMASALALADILKRERLPYSVRFIFFGAEENGVNGSQAYVDAMDGTRFGDEGRSLGDMDNVAGMLNLDTAWGGDFVYIHGASKGSQGWMREQLITTGESLNYDFEINPGNFISNAYWLGAGAQTVPQNTECVSGATYDAVDTSMGKEALTPSDFDPSDLIDTSAGNTTVQDTGYCVFLPTGTTGDWSDHGPFQGAGKEIAYIESTNFDIGDFDGYQQVKTLLDESGDGEIWHTDRDRFDYVNTNFPGKIQQQSTQIMDTVIAFLRDPNIPSVLSAPLTLESVSTHSSEIRGREKLELRGQEGEIDAVRMRLSAELETLEVSNTGIEALIAAIRAPDLQSSALYRRLTPQAQARLIQIKADFQVYFPEKP